MDISNNKLSEYSLEGFTVSGNDDFEVLLEKGNITLSCSKNIFYDILLTIEERKKLQSNEKVEIICCYYSGFDEKKSYLEAINKLHNKLLYLDNMYIYYNKGIPFEVDEDIVNGVSNILAGVENIIEYNNLIGSIEKNSFFKITDNNVINGLLMNAFYIILKEYLDNESEVNISKLKNFMVKILSWAKKYISIIFKNRLIGINPKIIYYGYIKKHECSFLIIMSMIGCDVIIFDPLAQLGLIKMNGLKNYITSYEGKIKENIEENPLEIISDKVLKAEARTDEFINKNLLNSSPMLAINLKRTNDIFRDIRFNVNDRGGYTEGDNQIIPIYFYRYIGLDVSRFSYEEYNNEIYLLDKELENSDCNYLKFIERIEPPQNNELRLIINSLDRIFNRIRILDKEVIFNEIRSNKLLPHVLNESVSNTIEYAIGKVLGIYLKNENTNLTQSKSFIAKLIVWINRYSKIVFKNIERETFFDFNPKVLYFGEIKYSEVYMLIFFSMVGCDVLFINSDYNADKIFECIDPEEQYTKLQRNSKSIEQGSFPKEEKIVRKSTIAFKASNEVEQLLFTPESGLYKHWQFERYNTIPITLKTTLEEISIFWSEEARVRPNFKMANNTVYIPNIFAKITGTYEDIKKYWNYINKLREVQNSYLISKIPFSKPNFTREELFSIAYVINKDGTVNKEKLIKSKFYKFSYMKDCTQNFMIKKINELIESDYFYNDIDSKFTLKIIFTVLNLNDEILRLIQNFDFPYEIPKLIFYINDKSNFSEEDIITIAFLNLIGIDIVILVPTGYNNIENYIKGKFFDTHELPSYRLNLLLDEVQNKKESKSVFLKIFKKHKRGE